MKFTALEKTVNFDMIIGNYIFTIQEPVLPQPLSVALK